MVDPLAEVVTLLQPGAPFAKIASAVAPWRVRRDEVGRSFFCVVLTGEARLTIDGHAPIALGAADFVLIPAACGFTLSDPSVDPASRIATPVRFLPDGEARVGPIDAPADARMLIGYCEFGSPDAALLVSLLPQFVHVRGDARLTALVQLVVDETRARRPARDVVLTRLLEVLLIEAVRSSNGTTPSPSLVRGLADDRLAPALRRMHEAPQTGWTVAQLAKEATLSRSAFFDRFSRALGVAPMEYLLAWRMALAKRMLRQGPVTIAAVAESVGYGSASTFSTAFSRHVGMAPARYARKGLA